MKAAKTLVCVLCVVVWYQKNNAQISPPGMGKGKTAAWFAASLRQDFGTTKKWRSQTYFGVGTKSNPDNYNLLQKPAILIFNQEFYYQFKKNWYTSFALSYRRQNEYMDDAPYSAEKPSIQQEFRLYGRLFYRLKVGQVQFSPAFRQELRLFYTPNFTPVAKDLQLRSRIRMQVIIPVTQNQMQWVTMASETFFMTSKTSHSNLWSNFTYSENRFTLYYSIAMNSGTVILDFGYMNDLVGTKSALYDVHYLAIDIMFNNVFNKRPKK